MFFPQACLVGFQNSACEHKGDHSKEIPDPTGPVLIRAWSMLGPCLLSFCEQARCLSVGASNLPGKTSTFKTHIPKTQCF